MAQKGIYVVSKIKHMHMWRTLREKGVDIVSSWIDDEVPEDIDFAEAWTRYLREVVNAQAVVVYADGGELKGGVLEIGAALGALIPIWVVGDIESIPALKTARHHPAVNLVNHASLADLLVELSAAQLRKRLS